MVEFTLSNVVTWVNESGITEHTESFGGGMGGGGDMGGPGGGSGMGGFGGGKRGH